MTNPADICSLENRMTPVVRPRRVPLPCGRLCAATNSGMRPRAAVFGHSHRWGASRR